MAWHDNSLAGWALLVAGMSFISASWLLPFVFDRVRHTGFNKRFYDRLTTDTELRMMMGFVLACVGMTAFALVTLIGFVLIRAGSFELLTKFTWIVSWTLMLPSAILIVMGKSMMLWDGYSATRGKRTCLWLLGVSGLLWVTGTLGTHWFIAYWWG